MFLENLHWYTIIFYIFHFKIELLYYRVEFVQMVHFIIELLYNKVKYKVMLFFAPNIELKRNITLYSGCSKKKIHYRVNHCSKFKSIKELLYFKVKYREYYCVPLEIVLGLWSHMVVASALVAEAPVLQDALESAETQGT